jgi:hypothetical protein
LPARQAVFAATLQNTDSQEYELQIKEEGRAYSRYYGPSGDEYRILEHCKTDICHYGCEMTLLDTGQRVWVNPRDEVVISYGVMKVNRAVTTDGADIDLESARYEENIQNNSKLYCLLNSM